MSQKSFFLAKICISNNSKEYKVIKIRNSKIYTQELKINYL